MYKTNVCSLVVSLPYGLLMELYRTNVFLDKLFSAFFAIIQAIDFDRAVPCIFSWPFQQEFNMVHANLLQALS